MTGPPSVTAAAVAAHYGNQFGLGGSHDGVPVFGRFITGNSYCSSIGNRHVAIHPVGHGPIE